MFIANLINVLVVPLKDIQDPFGNVILANHIYQVDGNTGLVAQTQIANDMVDLPKSYVKEDFLAKINDTSDFDVIAVSSYAEIEKYYDVLEVNGEIEIFCNDCFYDLKLAWEELKEDK